MNRLNIKQLARTTGILMMAASFSGMAAVTVHSGTAPAAQGTAAMNRAPKCLIHGASAGPRLARSIVKKCTAHFFTSLLSLRGFSCPAPQHELGVLST